MYRIVNLAFCLLTFTICYGQDSVEQKILSNIQKQTFTYSDSLKLDFYSLKSVSRTDSPPLIILVHGGGFSGGKRDNPLETKFCETMVTKGYAVVSMSYTLSRKHKLTGFGCNCPASEKIQTFKTTVEDILKATRFLTLQNELSFNRDKMILVGSSAGAEAVLMTAYQQEHPSFKELPYGKIKYAAVVALAGAILDARYINSENAVPAFLIHGEIDKLVPSQTAPHHYCSADKPGYLILDGSEIIAQKLKNLDKSYHLLTISQGNHDWANKGYEKTDEIASFLKLTVLEGKKVQSNLTIIE